MDMPIGCILQSSVFQHLKKTIIESPDICTSFIGQDRVRLSRSWSFSTNPPKINPNVNQ